MSILIRGMKMPKEDTKVLMIFPDGNVRIWGTDIDADKWAEAIEVPTQHGRLIDADAIPMEKQELTVCDHWAITVYELDNLPTIIPADKDSK